MRLSFFIAKRYLFSPKKQHAINIISAISVVGVAIGTAALIVILSVFNGIDLLLQESTDSFTPDIVLSPQTGKFACFDTLVYRALEEEPAIAFYSNVVEEKALVKYGERLAPVTVKGVEETYAAHTHIERNIVEGDFILKNKGGYQAVVGYGVAATLGIGLNFLTPLVFYFPNRKAVGNASALNTEYLFPSAFFSSQQEIDGEYVITDIDFARQLFGIRDRISKIEVKLTSPAYLNQVKDRLRQVSGERYKVEDKYELNKAFYAMMKSEKLAVFLILLFILLIASFNIVASIAMLILDKKEDLTIYRSMGMNDKRIISVFKTEGNLITLIGAALGLLAGTALCMLQEKYGFITLGDGSYIVTAYPVKLVWGDIVLIMVTVLAIGYTASYFPVRYLVNKLTNKRL